MSNVSTNRVRIEQWDVAAPGDPRFKTGRKVVAKIAVRNHLGHFHGATNYRGSRLNEK